jgi:membrane protein YqaA with SNARE-associated domain
VKQKLKPILQSPIFIWTFRVVSAFFIVATFFLFTSPDRFIQYGYPGVFVLNILGSGLVVMPVLATKMNLVLLVLACALGNIINTSINYGLGFTSTKLFAGVKPVNTMKRWLRKYETVSMYVLSMAPFPVDINAMLSGYIQIPYPKYLLVNFLGKVTIFTLLGLFVLLFQ